MFTTRIALLASILTCSFTLSSGPAFSQVRRVVETCTTKTGTYLTCSAACTGRRVATSGSCMIPGRGENADGTIQNFGVSDNRKSYYCTWFGAIRAGRVTAFCENP